MSDVVPLLRAAIALLRAEPFNPLARPVLVAAVERGESAAGFALAMYDARNPSWARALHETP